MIRRGRHPGFSRLRLWALGARYGDFRDWPAIDAWTDTIATALSTAHARLRRRHGCRMPRNSRSSTPTSRA